MSKLLVQLVRQVVQNEFVSEPGKRRFLNDASDIGEVLNDDDNAGKSSVIGINLDEGDEITWTSERAFERLSNLQFLRILGKCVNPQSMNYLSQKIRGLIWPNFKMTCFPSSFNPKLLVKLEMHSSKLVKFWEGIKPLSNLKWMDLSDSRKLEELPDLSTATNLHDLNLSDCERLVELPSSIGSAVNLHQLNFHNCMSLGKSSVIGINLDEGDEITWTSERAFERLSNLQFLGTKRDGVNLQIFPAEEVPQCFTYQSSGSSLTVKLNQTPLGTSTKFKACIVCGGEDEMGFREWERASVSCSITGVDFHRACFEFEVDYADLIKRKNTGDKRMWGYAGKHD
ncbi:hypothetical protein Bca52824_037895 [Brassica carinata]|uniref:C-JID domain-containing protein n=1 Tax=Brassica carinata TaxID=52824 RepID=A0A8X7UVG7_BRACI|nr:hypothetical protein Bca52824_037895 [Brassica carinata]